MVTMIVPFFQGIKDISFFAAQWLKKMLRS